MHVAKTRQKSGGQSGTIQGDLKREDGRKDNLDTEELEGWWEGKSPLDWTGRDWKVTGLGVRGNGGIDC